MKKNITYELFHLLNKEKITYAVLRNYESLPESCGGSDLDIFVASADCEKFYKILTNAAESTNSKLVSYTADALSPKVCYLNSTGGIQLDVFQGALCCKGHVMIPESDIIKNIVEYNGIKVVEPHLGDMIAFMKEVLNNGKCSNKYIEPLRENKDLFTETYLSERLSLFTQEFSHEVASTIGTNRYDESFAKVQTIGLKCLGKSKKIGSSKWSKLSRLFHQPGYTIAVLGTDGSGKSFIINSITPILNEAFHNGVRYEHMRPNYFSSLAVAAGRKKADTHEVCSNPHGSKPSGLIGSIARLTYYWLDYTYGYFRKVFLDKAFKTHLWIFDRYYYDYLLDQRRARLNMPEWIIKLYGIFVPRPDLTLCLGGDPEKIYARKPETSLEEVKRQTEVLHQFCKNHKNAVWIDTTLKPEESINSVLHFIYEMMNKKTLKRYQNNPFVQSCKMGGGFFRLQCESISVNKQYGLAA